VICCFVTASSRAEDIIEPELVPWADLRLVHTSRYLGALSGGTLGEAAERRMGLPWSEALVIRSRVAVQGTINAANFALDDGIGANLAGGTHHAFADHGEGFCVLNDVAVAIRVLQRAGRLRRALVIDLDVHQGNGTASIFATDARVVTFSMHGAKNFPIRKETSTVDVPLPDGIDDDAYMRALEKHLGRVIDEARPDLVFYVQGVDVLADDKFGRLALTMDGLRRRDRFVLETLSARELPMVLCLGGGYAPTPRQTAERHAIMHREAAALGLTVPVV
jgi:acetoin utilization deacetylase AcuC-like enzyme